MIAKDQDIDQRELEAADWFARLARVPIETEELTAFQRWSRDPANLAAYNHIEDISRAVRGLRDDPALRAAAKEALARPPERSGRALAADWRIWGGGLAFVSAIAAAVFVFKPLSVETYSTRVGEISSVRLDDGSQVRLNTDSKLRIRFSGGQRRVELLRGQAYFEVAHDAARPFVVAAGDAKVRAIGTQFDVRRLGEETQVVLAEGKVAVGQKATHWTLTPGQGVTLGGADGRAPPRPVDVAAMTSWRTGRLTLHDVTLADAVAELNRYSKTKILLTTSAPGSLKISGAFEAGDLDDFVAAATTAYDLKDRRLPNGDIELSAGAPKS
jgi:transmembrane sensor